MSIVIRTERKEDYSQVWDVNFQAFGNREDEAKLVDRIRLSEYFIPNLSIVAEINNEIIGHILLSKAEVFDTDMVHEVIVLAPIAVKPGHQNQGIGKQLILEAFNRCKDMGYFIVMLIGHPTYYPKFEFKQARQFGLELTQFEVSDDVFMVCELKSNELSKIKGELKYPKAFLG
ncbi:GNAT family N-acetyltransferase [Paenibacillus terrigena]|uniref:GNAT family N-acetyltransferase n=1 Tax=Paenibacillus terrigena TaxID=369333 RepID=UPI0003725AB9|nr:N-acetyltransferase [Paenibacillus terrigena]